MKRNISNKRNVIYFLLLIISLAGGNIYGAKLLKFSQRLLDFKNKKREECCAGDVRGK